MSGEKQTSAAIDPAMLIAALKALPPEALSAVLMQSGAAPTTIGMSPEHFQMLIASLNPAAAMREAYRQQRKENPNYPEISVFNPRGRFDHDGVAQKPKSTFRRATFFMNVRLGGEAEQEHEIDLCNRFTDDRSSRNGTWTATIKGKGTLKEELFIVVPSRTPDDRAENSYPFDVILKELLEGAEAVNQGTMVKRITELESQLKALTSQNTTAV